MAEPRPGKLLAVACDFPPLGGSGVQRTAFFVRTLPGLGWRPHVLTETPHPGSALDPELARRVEDVPVTRVRGLRLPGGLRRDRRLASRGGGGSSGRSRRLRALVTGILVPDKRIGWLPAAVRAGRRLLRRGRFDAIYSTSPFPTAHLAARRLAAHSGLPWVVDLRDPWWFFLEARPRWPFSALNERLEGSVIRRADAVLGVREGLLEDLHRRFPDLDPGKLHLVPNGYDPDAFAGVEPRRDPETYGIVYAGLLHDVRSPRPLFRAVRRVLDAEPDLGRRVRIRILGPDEPDLEAWREACGLPASSVEVLGFRPHGEAVAWMRGADLLYLNSVEDYVPGKVYEYLGAGREILALLEPGSEVGRLLAGRSAARVVPPDDAGGAAEIVADRLRTWAVAGPAPDHPPATEFSRLEACRRLAGILDGLAAGT